MKTLQKLVLATLALSAATCFATEDLKLVNKHNEPLTAHLSEAVRGQSEVLVGANETKSLDVDDALAGKDITITWKNAAGEVKDTDVVHIDADVKAAGQVASSSVDGEADKLD